MANGSDGLAAALEEYGLLLTEMGPTGDLLIPIKSSSRIKYTCMTLSKKFIVMGANTGGLYLFDRLSLRYLRLMGNKDGSVQMMSFAKNHHLLGVATSVGVILVWYVGSRTRGKPKFIKKSEEHKDASILSLCWDNVGSQLFAGDDRGVISITNVPAINLPSQSDDSPSNAKKFKIRHPNVVIAKAKSPIIQLDYAHNKLLISTMTKCVVLELASLEYTPVGTKPREGWFGACFVKEKNSETLTIYTARPGSRLWEASIDGQVLSTQQYRELLAIPPAPILGFGRSATLPPVTKECSPHSVNFAKLLLLRDRYLVTWHGSSVYILDAVMGQVVSWHEMNSDVADVCCLGNEFYVYHCDGLMTWYSLLSVKECVARLFEMHETKQCTKVALECQYYIIPGAARDLVPVAMVTKLRGLLDAEEECKDLVASLEELEKNLEPETVMRIVPPGIPNRGGDSPDTLSICSDAVHGDDPYTATADSGVEDDDNLSVTHGDECSEKTGAKNKMPKKFSVDVSLEKILMSAAAKAKKFSEEKQFGRGRLLTRNGLTLADLEGTEGGIQTSGLSDSSLNAHTLSDLSSEAGAVAFDVQGTGTWKEESEGVLLVKKATSTAGSHSDESDTPPVLGDDRKDKPEVKDKRKKKKRVTTVDIDSPHFKGNEDMALMSPEGLGSSHFHRGTYSSFGNTEVNSKKLLKERSLSDSGMFTKPVRRKGEVPTEITATIPAMFSKARGLLKRLKPSEDGAGTLECLSKTETLSEDGVDFQNEDVVIQCPEKVQELTTVSAQVRSALKNPAVLCNTRVLRKTLFDWVQQLHATAEFCEKLDKQEEAKDTEEEANDTEEGASATEEKAKGIEKEANGTEQEAKGNEEEANGTEEEANGTEEEANGTEEEANDTEEEANGTEEEANGTEEEANGTEEEANGTEEEANGTEEEAKGTEEDRGHVNLKTFLENSALEDLENVSFLAGMCFELGIYGSPIMGNALPHDNHCECINAHNILEHEDVESDVLNHEDHKVRGDVRNSSTQLSQISVLPRPSVNLGIDCTNNHRNIDGCATSGNNEKDSDIASCTKHRECTPSHELWTNDARSPDGTSVNGHTSEVCSSEDHDSSDVLRKATVNTDAPSDSPVLKETEEPSAGRSECPSCSRCCQGNTNPAQSGEVAWWSPLCEKKKDFVFISQNAVDRKLVKQQQQRERTRDQERAMFVLRFFDLLSVKRLRRTLKMSPGCRTNTWSALLRCLQSVAVQHSVHQYICEGHVTRALHELHDKPEEFQDALLHHLMSLYKQDSRQTVLACARMFPDVQPCEVSQMCRHVVSRDVQSGASDFALYMKELMRWRAETGETREHIVADICRDSEVMMSWFHNVLLADQSVEDRHCRHCGQPRPGSHMFPWQHEDQLHQIIDHLCQRSSNVVLVHFMNLCWKHGYWSGLVRLMVRVGHEEDAVSLVVQLGDVSLLSKTQPWGVLPKSLKEWRRLIELVASRSRNVNLHHACVPFRETSWTPDLSWETVLQLALEQLGAGHTVDIITSLSCPKPPMESHFYYKCVAGAVIEKKQRSICHGLVKTLDSYLWSQRTNALSPKLNMYREEDQRSGTKIKDDSKPQLEPFAHVTTLEDAASPWGVNLRLVDSECIVCSLPLCEQISTSNQGLVVFECGHVFHKQCVQENACVACFYGKLTTVGRTSTTR